MKTLVNVGGVSRSGSTLVHLMLGNAPDAFACGEAMNHFRTFMKDQTRPSCVCGQVPCPVWCRLDNLTEDRFYATAFDRLDVNYIIDSSWAPSWLLDARRWARQDEITVYNLFAWKNPLNLAYSFWKRGHGPMYWRRLFVKYYSRIFSAGLPLLTVNCGELVQDAPTKLRQICDAIGMPYFEGKENFWELQHHLMYCNTGVRKQLMAGDSSVQAHDSFPPEFQQHVDLVLGKVAKDTKVRYLIEQLQQADVSRVQQPVPVVQHFVTSRRRPAWYYAQMLRQFLRGRLTGELVNSDPENVATNPSFRGPHVTAGTSPMPVQQPRLR